jgi:superfamily II DNA or RNA helicase
MTVLYDHQQEIYFEAKKAFTKYRIVCIQSATGSGKTIIFVSMCEAVNVKEKLAWIVVTRKELMQQTSKHLLKWGIPHNLIKPGSQESRAYNIHVASSDTLIRRLDNIKRPPDLIIFDECHVMLDRQIKIVDAMPKRTKILGFSATPERADGRGLSELYETLIEGKSIPWLTENKYLTPLRYFAPPIDGLESIKRKGSEYDEEELEELLKRRAVYGKAIDHYERYGIGRQALFFCRSVKAAENLAEQFRNRGHRFYNIDGRMADGKRYQLVNALNKGEIDGLCGCDVFIYGLDVPRVSYGGMLRPTLSKTIYYQSIGRILRPFSDPETGFVKKDALFFDHVNNLLEHQEPDYPGVPPHYVPHIDWNFYGKEKKKKELCPKCKYFKSGKCGVTGETLKSIKTRCKYFAPEAVPRLCPHLDFMYCTRANCYGCKYNKNNERDARKPMIVVEAELLEKDRPKPLNERDNDDRREIREKIASAIIEYKENHDPGPIEILLNIGKSLGYKPLWVYWKLTPESQITVNVSLLHEIARIKNYKPYWCVKAQEQIEEQIKSKNEYRRDML